MRFFFLLSFLLFRRRIKRKKKYIAILSNSRQYSICQIAYHVLHGDFQSGVNMHYATKQKQSHTSRHGQRKQSQIKVLLPVCKVGGVWHRCLVVDPFRQEDRAQNFHLADAGFNGTMHSSSSKTESVIGQSRRASSDVYFDHSGKPDGIPRFEGSAKRQEQHGQRSMTYLW